MKHFLFYTLNGVMIWQHDYLPELTGISPWIIWVSLVLAWLEVIEDWAARAAVKRGETTP